MLDWERWTLTHSSAGDAELVVLLGLGLATVWASSVAVTDGDPEADRAGDADAETEVLFAPDGEAVVLLSRGR